MAGSDDWKKVIPVDTSGDVHVATRSDGIAIFYTERETAYIRTDTVKDLQANR